MIHSKSFTSRIKKKSGGNFKTSFKIVQWHRNCYRNKPKMDLKVPKINRSKDKHKIRMGHGESFLKNLVMKRIPPKCYQCCIVETMANDVIIGSHLILVNLKRVSFICKSCVKNLLTQQLHYLHLQRNLRH